MNIWFRVKNNIIVEVFDQSGFTPPGFGLEEMEWHEAVPNGETPREGDAFVEGAIYPQPKYASSFNLETRKWLIDEEAALPQEKEFHIEAENEKTMAKILAGFEYTIQGQEYHFGYDLTDQGNFTKAAVAATLSLMQQNAAFRQAWRGWIGDAPHTLSLTAMEFLGLATYAGKDHQEGCLAAGWLRTERIRAAGSLAELEEIVSDFA